MNKVKLQTIFLFVIIVLAGCAKSNDDPAPGSMSGRWVVTRVHDKGVGADLVPPAGYSGQVYLEFRGDKFSGQTMRNGISEGTYTMTDNKSISFGTFSSTVVVENEWGGAFMTMLHSCMLQSVYPCRPSTINWQSDRVIEVNTPMRYTITLVKN